MQPNVPVIGRAESTPTILVKRLALETVVAEGRVQGARVVAIRGSFAATPQILPMHSRVNIQCELNGFVYAVNGATLTGMKLGVDENGAAVVEGYWVEGTYDCGQVMGPAGGA